jgi:hypothetical protein
MFLIFTFIICFVLNELYFLFRLRMPPCLSSKRKIMAILIRTNRPTRNWNSTNNPSQLEPFSIYFAVHIFYFLHTNK